MTQPLKNNLARLRKLCRLSQPEAAMILTNYLGYNIDFTTISSHENGRRGLGQDEQKAYARLYKVPAHVLFQSTSSEEELIAVLKSQEWDWPV